MDEITITPVAAEPEELIEASLVSRLASACTIPVEGVLTPASAGSVKSLSADTFVGVKVDQSSQDGDYAYRAPMTYSATATVHFALADDADGSSFRDECRAVRAALLALIGDRCSALNVSDAFVCDAFALDSTSTNFDGGESPVYTKSYTATIKGRIIQPTNTTEAN